MSYIRDTAFVLKTEPFREADVFVTLYGKMHGKLTAVARSGKKMDAKSLGHLEPFSEVEVMIARGAAFDKLAVATVIRPRPDMREHLAGLAIAGAFFDAVNRLTAIESPDPALFHLLGDVLDRALLLPKDAPPERARTMYTNAILKLLDILGYGNRLEHAPLSQELHGPKTISALLA